MAGIQPLQFQGVPLISTPLVNPDGTINLAWYRFFIALYIASGLDTPGVAVIGANNPDTGLLNKSATFVVDFHAAPTNSLLYVLDRITGKLKATANLTSV